MDADGRVAAIGNGGLKGGTIGLGWAISAEWLDKLITSTEANPIPTAEQWSIILDQFLYGSQARPSVTGTRHFSSSFELVGREPSAVAQGFFASEPVFGSCLPLSSSFTTWKLTPKAHSGRYAINLIPEGNPVTVRTTTATCNSPTLSVSAGILDRVFETQGATDLRVGYFRLSTSNPRPGLNGCDSSMSIYVKRDQKDWQHYSAMCGEHKSNGGSWDRMTFDIPTLGASSVQLGFLYQVQNVDGPDPYAMYLIDDLDVRVVP